MIEGGWLIVEPRPVRAMLRKRFVCHFLVRVCVP